MAELAKIGIIPSPGEFYGAPATCVSPPPPPTRPSVPPANVSRRNEIVSALSRSRPKLGGLVAEFAAHSVQCGLGIMQTRL